jgi:hypothetical protein
VTIQHYLKHKSVYEALLWVLFILWQLVANIYVALEDTAGTNHERWEPILWESSSTIMFAFLLPALLIFDKRFPIHFSTLKKHLPIHILATIPFSLMHVAGMVAMRETAYWHVGSDYNFGHWPTELAYEYAKDFRTYFYLLIIIYLYRLVLFRAQGEASVPDTSDEDASNDSHQGARQHLLVKKLGKEFLVKIEEIEWLEACGNYVNLYVSGRAYPYRGTMKSLQEQLDPKQFLRVHRSYMVNYAEIQSIEPLESGDAKIQLRQGKELPFSRRYRADFKQAS